MSPQTGLFVPGFSSVGGAEHGGVFDAGVAEVGIGERGLEVPDALEFPGMLGAVVPLVRRQWLAFGRLSVVGEFIAFALGHAVGRRRGLAGFKAGLMPGFSTIVGALD